MPVIRWLSFMFGMMIFSLGIALAVQVQYLGVHPWDVLNVALYNKVGLSIGTWAIIISFVLIAVSFVLDKSYIRIGTLINALVGGLFVDMYLWLGFLPEATNSWIDIIYMLCGIVIMGAGGGLYNAGGVGAGPRDGFMLSIADKTGKSIRSIRITAESGVLVLGILLGGPVFIFTFIFTFIQSPIFQFTYLQCSKYIEQREEQKVTHNEIAK